VGLTVALNVVSFICAGGSGLRGDWTTPIFAAQGVLAPAQFVKRLHPRKVDDGVKAEGIDTQGESNLHPTKPLAPSLGPKFYMARYCEWPYHGYGTSAIGSSGMRDWNTITLIGNIGQDAELRTTSAGKQVLHLSLATSDRWQDPVTKEWKSQTEWHNLVAWEKTAETLAPLAKKGNRLMIRGKLRYREQTKGEVKFREAQINVEDYGKMEKTDRVGGETSTGPAAPVEKPEFDF